MSHPAVIIIGCPRSGTSLVSRILQNSFGIMICEPPILSDERNPDGYYEDRRLKCINQDMIKRWKVGTGNHEKVDMKWATAFSQFIVHRNQLYDWWGFKDPVMMGFIHWVFQFLKDPIFIWPIRSDEQIIKSQIEKFDYPEDVAIKGVSAYKELIYQNIIEKGYKTLKMDLSYYREETDVETEIGEFLWQ